MILWGLRYWQAQDPPSLLPNLDMPYLPMFPSNLSIPHVPSPTQVGAHPGKPKPTNGRFASRSAVIFWVWGVFRGKGKENSRKSVIVTNIGDCMWSLLVFPGQKAPRIQKIAPFSANQLANRPFLVWCAWAGSKHGHVTTHVFVLPVVSVVRSSYSQEPDRLYHHAALGAKIASRLSFPATGPRHPETDF